MSADLPDITNEVIDFLLSAPTAQQIIAFHASNTAQDRLRVLLDASRSRKLTPDESAELDEMNWTNRFFTLIKARAMKMIKDRETATHG